MIPVYPPNFVAGGIINFFPHASRSLLCIQFVAVGFRSEDASWRWGLPWRIFVPPWIRTWADLAKNNNTCKGLWVQNVLHLYQVLSKSIKRFWRRSWKCKKFTDNGRRDMAKAELNFRLSWAKKTNFHWISSNSHPQITKYNTSKDQIYKRWTNKSHVRATCITCKSNYAVSCCPCTCNTFRIVGT